MNSLQDALYNWLTIKIVKDERPDDTAAVETEKMFRNILIDDQGITNVEVSKDEVMYFVHFDQGGERKKKQFPREMVEIMLNQINEAPEKYRNYPDE